MNTNNKRLLTLFSINVIIIVHIILWYKLGFQKIGTLSLNGVVTLFGMGLLNSAALFFILVFFATMIFGRVFCGWACHFAFFQELALKILNKIGINPQIIHSRANIIQYVFLLKTLLAIIEYWLIYGHPQFHIGIGDTQVMTVDLPRNPVIIAAFIIFDAFLLIYLFGSRAFCRYICPWGPMLAFFDNFSSWRIRKANECKGCQTCTNNCSMGIQVHEEIFEYDAVINPNCIRCLACKNACPNGTLIYEQGKSAVSVFHRIKWLLPEKSQYGLYADSMLILFGLTIAYYTQVWLGSFQTFLGAAWGLSLGIVIIQFAYKHINIAETGQEGKRVTVAGLLVLSTFAWCWLTITPYDMRLLLKGNRFMETQEYEKAVSIYKETIKKSPSNDDAHAALALAYKIKGDYNNAILEYKSLISKNPQNAALHNNLGTVYYRSGDYNAAIEEYKKAIQLDEGLLAAYGNLGLIFLKHKNIKDAVPLLRKVYKNEEEVMQYILLFYKSKENPSN